MCVVEGDQVRQCAHACVRQRGQVVRDLGSKLIEQCRGLIAVVSENVAGINVNDSCAETFHHAQRIFCKRDGQLVAWNATTVVAVIEKADIASDHGSLECVRIEKLRVIAGQLMSKYFTKR